MTASGEFVPVSVRTEMAHAHVQWLAQARGIRLLHIKGAALDPSLRWEGRDGSDADILVPYSRTQEIVTAMCAAGWTMGITFQHNSSFEHASTLRHAEFGWADIHRFFPGLGGDADETFDRLWAERRQTSLGGLACAVPSLPAQALILLLHAGRSPGIRTARDIEVAWTQADPDQRALVTNLADELDARVGLAAALGNLDDFRDRPEYDLWRIASRGGTRLEDWWARVHAAPTRRDAVRTVLRAPLVNREHLRMTLWREPTTWEVFVEFFARPARGLSEESRRLGSWWQARWRR